MNKEQSFGDAMRGYNRRKAAQRAADRSSLMQAADQAGYKLYGDRAGTPESARRYFQTKRARLIWAGDCNCITQHIF